MLQDYIHVETGEILENMASRDEAVARFQHYEVDIVSPDDVITYAAYKKVKDAIKSYLEREIVKASSQIW